MLCRMTRGLTQKQEDFCRFYIELGSSYLSYVRVYGEKNAAKKTLQQMASRNMAKPAIKERIAELQAMNAEASGMTMQRLAEQFLEDRRFARKEGNAAAAVKATENLGKLLGFFVEKKEITHGMRPDEARATIEALLPGLTDLLGKTS